MHALFRRALPSLAALSSLAVLVLAFTFSTPRPAFAKGMCEPWEFGCDESPPTVTIIPGTSNYGAFGTTYNLSVTIEWCDNVGLSSGSRSIVFRGTDVTASFNYSSGTRAGCTTFATSTGTVTLQVGSNSFSASINDLNNNTGSDNVSYGYTSSSAYPNITTATTSNVNALVSSASHAFDVNEYFGGQWVYQTSVTGQRVTVPVGDSVQFTLTATDDAGLNNVWWDVYDETYTLVTGFSTTLTGTSGTATAKYPLARAGTWRVHAHVSDTHGQKRAVIFSAIAADVTHQIVSIGFTNQDNQSMALCGNACFAVTHAQSTVPYFSMDQPRSVTLVYHGDRVAVRPFVYADVSLYQGSTVPSEYWLQVKDSLTGAFLPFVNGDATKHVFSTASGLPVRLGGQIDMSGYATSVRPIQVIVTAVRTAGNEQVALNGRLMIVNERTSPIARGWTVGGLQRLYPTNGGLLVTDGDGSASFFSGTCAAPCWYTAPDGEYSSLRSLNTDGTVTYLRAYRDSTKAWFGTTGLVDSIADSFGNKTTFTYDASSRLIRVYDPIRTDTTGAQQYIGLTYGTHGLSEIEEPGPGRATTGGRIARVTVASDSTLRSFKDPDNDSTRFTYDANRRLERVINRRGDTTRFVYDTLFSWRLIKTILPRVAINAGGGATVDSTPVVRFRPWQLVPLPTATTSTGSKATPAALDAMSGQVTDPSGFVTTVLVDRWGQPLTITDPLGRVTTITRSGVLPTIIRSPTGAEDRIGYDGPVIWTKPAGRDTTYFTFGAYGRVTQIHGPGQPFQVFYTGVGGRIDSVSRGSSNYKTRYQYDSRGRVTLVRDPGADTTRFGYDARFGNRDSTLSPGNRYKKSLFDGYGRDSASLAAGRPPSLALYDVLNRVTQTRDSASASPTTYTYDKLYLTRIQDPKGQVYRIEVNGLGWRTREYDPADTLSRYVTYLYNPSGLITSYTNRRSQRVDLQYDGAGRITSKRGPGGVFADTFAYATNMSGELILARNTVSRDSIFISALGWTDSAVTRLASDSTKRFRIGYTPDAMQRLDLTSITTNAGIAFTSRRLFWSSGAALLDSITLNGTTIKFARGDEGQRDTTTWAWSLVRTDSYTRLHQPSTVSYNNSTINGAMWRSYSYDSLARMTEVGRKDGSGYAFRFFDYTRLGQLRRVEDATLASSTSTCPGTEILDDYGNQCQLEQQLATQQVYEFTYDSLSNLRKEKNVTANDSTLGTFTPGNRLTQLGATPYAYDLDGNLQRRRSGADSVRYHWSADGRLDSVTTSGLRLHYEYNAFGQLVRVIRNGSVHRHYLWDGDHLVAELSSSLGSRIAEYAYYPRIDRPLAIMTGAQSVSATRYFHQDHIGNVIGVSTTTTLAQQLDYDVWGKVVSITGVLADTNRLRWKGLVWEGDSTRLYYMRNRWYDPEAKRFASEDPIGLTGGINLYAFAAGDPINFSDPYGTCPNGQELVITIADDGSWTAECVSNGGSPGGVMLSTVTVTPDPWRFSTPRESGFSSNFGERGLGLLGATRTPRTGPPNTIQLFPDKTIRMFGPHGRWLQDLDYHNPHGDQTKPHLHKIDESLKPPRQPWVRPTPEDMNSFREAGLRTLLNGLMNLLRSGAGLLIMVDPCAAGVREMCGDGTA